MSLPFMWSGYVITDNRNDREAKGFWSLFPREIVRVVDWLDDKFGIILRRDGSCRFAWDYWSVKDEIEFRALPKCSECGKSECVLTDYRYCSTCNPGVENDCR